MCVIEDGWAPKGFSPVSPTYDVIGSERRFGVELEYQWVPDDYMDLEEETVFGAKEDCSVEGGEFDSPILYADQGIEACNKFCRMAINNCFEVGQGAGYHLHLDMTNEPLDGLKRIALAYHYTKGFWLGAVPAVRREFTYSRSHQYNRNDVLSWQVPDDVMSFANRYDRYSWVNWLSYLDHRTVEIRCHESVTDASSVINWVIAHTRFCDAVGKLGVGRITRIFGNKKPQEIFREIRAILKQPDVSEHLRKRYREFNPA